ncbi:MAG: hypothetical protein QM644_12565 [Mobilitalea sp.]
MKKKLIVSVILAAFIILWFSDFLPKQVVKVVASNYISKQEDGDNYKFKLVEYSPAHDSYMVYFYDTENSDAELRNLGVYYRWFPFKVYYDSVFPG